MTFYDIYDVCRLLTFVAYDVHHIMTFVSYDVCCIMRFVGNDDCHIMMFVAYDVFECVAYRVCRRAISNPRFPFTSTEIFIDEPIILVKDVGFEPGTTVSKVWCQ